MGIYKSDGLDSRSTDCGNDRVDHFTGKDNNCRFYPLLSPYQSNYFKPSMPDNIYYLYPAANIHNILL